MVLSPRQIAFREAHRKARNAGDPLPTVADFAKQMRATVKSHKVGDVLTANLKSRFDVQCTLCFAGTVRELNAMSIQEVRDSVSTYAPMVFENVHEAATRGWQWAKELLNHNPKSSSIIYRELILEACDECETALTACEPTRIDSRPSSLPVQMVAPGDIRPGIYRGGIVQVMVTRSCDLHCNNCTQGSNLKGAVHHMAPEQFRVAVTSLKDYFGVVGMFGGNPCLHPQFPELCEIMRDVIPWERRGLWANHPRGMGRHAAITFNPAFSNLNVHQSQAAHDEFVRDWPESSPYLKGLDADSRHAPVWTSMRDLIPNEQDRWDLIGNCDINKNWSALIGTFRGMLRGWFCEIAGAQSMLHQHDPDYPDTGVPVVPGWWRQGMSAFEGQVRKHCHECGIPLRGYGSLANSSGATQYTETHQSIIKTRGKDSQLITDLVQLGSKLPRATDYIENGSLQ